LACAGIGRDRRADAVFGLPRLHRPSAASSSTRPWRTGWARGMARDDGHSRFRGRHGRPPQRRRRRARRDSDEDHHRDHPRPQARRAEGVFRSVFVDFGAPWTWPASRSRLLDDPTRPFSAEKAFWRAQISAPHGKSSESSRFAPIRPSRGAVRGILGTKRTVAASLLTIGGIVSFRPLTMRVMESAVGCGPTHASSERRKRGLTQRTRGPASPSINKLAATVV